MATEFLYALGTVAPVYNLAFALIAFFLFYRLFKMPNRLVYLRPWKVLFLAFCVYIVEEIFTVLRKLGVMDFPRLLNGLFEMVIIALFIYMLLLQKEYIKKTHIWRVKRQQQKEKVVARKKSTRVTRKKSTQATRKKRVVKKRSRK